MKRALLLTVAVVSSVPFLVAADDGALMLGSVEAVYHEGVVTFTVEHPEAVSASVRVYDLETDSLIYDSGPRARTRVTWPAGYDLAGGYRYLVTAWNAEGEVVVSQIAANKRQTPISEISFDTVPGDSRMVGPDEIDLLGDVNVGSIPGVRLLQDYNGKGGGIELYDEGGFSRTAYMLPTGSTTGGQIRVLGPSGAAWMQGEHPLHGNEAALGVFGTSDFYVWAGETGDDSVQMPDDAVSAAEMKDEPGVATVFESNNPITLVPLENETVLSASVRSDGYVFATGYVEISINNSPAGGGESCTCGLSDYSGGSLPEREIHVAPDPNAPVGWHTLPVRLSGIFRWGGQIYINCVSNGIIGTGAIVAKKRHLELIWFPTAYGTVSVPED